MSSWNMGYNTDTNYESNYFSILNPYLLRFLFISQGISFPKLDEHTTACELGFGQGLSIVVHGGASKVKWYGNDFMPSQVLFASKMAQKGGIKVNLYDDSFDEILDRDDLPMFDYICLHGIWSWISPHNQDVILEFIKRKLKVGGVVYISYNITSVNEIIEPIRYLFKNYIDTFGQPDLNHVQNIPQALKFIEDLMKLNPLYVQQAPLAQNFFKTKFLDKVQNYLSHEYLNDNWFLESFSKVSQKLEGAKLSYVCQAMPMEDIETMQFHQPEIEAMHQIDELGIYQHIKDYYRCAGFRSDVYVKGIVKLSSKQQQQLLDDTYFILITDAKSIDSYTFSSRLGNNLKLNAAPLTPLMKILSDYQVHSYKELRQALCNEEGGSKDLTRLLFDALAINLIQVAIPPHEINDEVVQQCRQLNQFFMENKDHFSINVLASPVLGGGVFADNLTKSIINHIVKYGEIDKDQIIAIMKDGLTKSMQDSDLDNSQTINTLETLAQNFIDFNIPLFRSLRII